ncbi:hypothetical protein EDD15DRAFT_2215239 [Pisolithus albus]|nr:hypothetical protein EDD15DRAFT_2215239 [Pisolithus albus]
MSPTTTGQLNRAITVGTEKGNFVLPKGPSGKVKLAPERTTGTPKEVRWFPSSYFFPRVP